MNDYGLQRDIDNTKRGIESLIDSLVSRIEELESSNDTLQGQVDELEEENQELKSRIEDFEDSPII